MSLPSKDGVFGQQRLSSGNNDFNALTFFVQRILSTVNIATLVKVVTVNTNGPTAPVGTVDVQPLVNQIDGSGKPTSHETVYGVPYIRVQGGTNAVILDPKEGDIGLCVFCDRDISSVKASAKVANPGTARRFSYSDGIYLGGWNSTKTPTNYVKISDDGIKVVSTSLIDEQSIEIKKEATNVTETVTGQYTIIVPELHIVGNLHVDGIVHCTWEGNLIAVGFGGTGADLSLTGGPDNVVLQETVGGPFTVKPINQIPSVLTYTNTLPVPATLGGIVAGSTHTQRTMQQMWDELLYPYQYPEFISFSINGQNDVLEVGDTSNVNPSFIWTSINSINMVNLSIYIRDITSGELLASHAPDTGGLSITHAGITRLTPSQEQYQIQATNTKSELFSRDYYINWEWLMYFGESATKPLIAADITGLRISQLGTDFAGTYAFSAATDEYKCICYPSSWGTATKFNDALTGFSVPFDNPYIITVTNAHGCSTTYRCHQSAYLLGGAIDIVVS